MILPPDDSLVSPQVLALWGDLLGTVAYAFAIALCVTTILRAVAPERK